MTTIFCRDGFGRGVDVRFDDFFYGHPTLADSRTLRYGDRADPAPLSRTFRPGGLEIHGRLDGISEDWRRVVHAAAGLDGIST